jgi:hypothetical protein
MVDENSNLKQTARMTKETLLEIDNRRPFRPYTLRLNNGDAVHVEKPEHCLVTEDEQTLIWNERGGKIKFIAVANITMIEENGSVKRGGKK